MHDQHLRPMRRALILLGLLGLGPLLAWWLPVPAALHGVAGYLPLHDGLETIAVVVAGLIFAIGWNAERRELQGSSVILACVFLGVGLLDFSHALSYAGTPDYVTPSGAEKAINFWLAARTLAALALLAVALAPWRPFARQSSRYLLLGAVLVATALIHALLLFSPDRVPRTFVPGIGLTGFKIAAEYLLIGLNLTAALALWMRMRRPQVFNAASLFAAVCTMALSECFFTLYATVTDVYNLMGHLYKVIAYLFLYRAMFVEAIERPYVQLQATRDQLRSTLEAIPDLLWLKDVDGVYLDCNPAFERYVGHPRSAVVGKTDHDFVAHELATTFRNNDLKALAADQPSIDEKWLTFASDGYRGLFETVKTPVRDAQGRTVGVLGIARDVTAARGAAENLRLRDSALTQISQGVMITDRALNLCYVNPGFERLTGYSAAEVLGRNPRFLQGPETSQASVDLLRAAIEAGHEFRGEILNVRKDGSRVWIDLDIAPMYDPAGTLTGFVGTQRDVSERRLAEAERQSLELQLRESQRMESIGTLAGGIAHDFNNILGAILGNLALARIDLPAGHPALASLEQIGKASVRARDLVQQILTFSHRQPQAMTRQALGPLVDETVALLRSVLPAQVNLLAEIGPRPVFVDADGTQIQQVLMNLCTNAWHALQGGSGSISIGLDEVGLDGDAARAVGAAGPGAYAHLWVHDTGHGIPAEARSRIFEPFFTTKPKGQGTGLGLSVVHGIVVAHHGAIGVDSAPGRGTTFDLYLPAQPPPAPPNAPAPSPIDMASAGWPGHGEQVMIVDDDEVMLLMVERLLQRHGYRVTSCPSVAVALEHLQAAPQGFDIVVSDYNMPDRSGLELAEALPAIRADLPVVISSGFITDELRRGAERTGVRAVIQKQDTLDVLPRLLRSLLTR